MTHDPLCLEPECERSCVGWCEGEDGTHYCQCQLIARVRADERERAAQRVEAEWRRSRAEIDEPPLLMEVKAVIVQDAAAARGEA